MKSRELKRIWKTLAAQDLVEKKLAKEAILDIISQEGIGVLGKIERKLRLDYRVYFALAILIPLVALFVYYYDSQSLHHKSVEALGRQYSIFFLFEAFIFYALWTVRSNLNFVTNSSNSGTLKASLNNIKAHFQSIKRSGFWFGTLGLLAVLSFVLYDTQMRMGGIDHLNFSFSGPFVYESFFSLFLLALIVFTPFAVRLEAKKYAGELNDLDATLEELNEESIVA